MLNQSPIRLLAALDENYLPRLQVLLTSVFINNPEEKMELYLIHRNIPEKSLEKLRMQCRSFHYPLHLIQVDASFFQNAPVSSGDVLPAAGPASAAGRSGPDPVSGSRHTGDQRAASFVGNKLKRKSFRRGIPYRGNGDRQQRQPAASGNRQ